jgi:adenosylhomocysteine nucleosidase
MHPEFRSDGFEGSDSPDFERVLFCFAVEQEAKFLARRAGGGLKRMTRASGNPASDPDHRLIVTLHPDGRLEEMEILITGVGRENAERKLHGALKRAPYQLVLSCGFAGGLNPYLTVGTVVFSTDEDAGLTPALLAAGACPVRFHSADRVATTVAEKQALWKETGADAVEMESQIIRAICRAHEIPSATIRVISDAAHEDLPLDFNVLMTAEQKLNYGRLALALLGSPKKIPDILRLQRQTQAAARNLAQVLTRVVPG